MAGFESAVGIRRAMPFDAAAIASIHITSWQETYTNILPQAMIDEQTFVRRQYIWSQILAQKSPDSIVHIATLNDGDSVGFIHTTPQRSNILTSYDAEITALYILAKAQKRGIGRNLVKAAANSLSMNGNSSVSLWVLAENLNACSFYEALDATLLGELIDERPTGPLHEIAYGWNDLSVLCTNTPLGSP